MKYGPKYKIARRLGSALFEKTQTQKYALHEQRKGMGRRPQRRSKTDFGIQLLEKQKARFMYGISERQFRNYVRASMNVRDTDPTHALYAHLETRLDNAVYRAGFAPTRQAARQYVSHGHFVVNGKRTTVPSFVVSAGDVVTVREGSKEKGMFVNVSDHVQSETQPAWLATDVKKMSFTVNDTPTFTAGELPFDIQAIIEFYSR